MLHKGGQTRKHKLKCQTLHLQSLIDSSQRYSRTHSRDDEINYGIIVLDRRSQACRRISGNDSNLRMLQTPLKK